MARTEMTKQAMAEAGAALAGKGAVHMVNLLRYRERADYGSGSALPPCSGQEAYFQRYIPAFARVAAKVAPGEAFAPVYIGNVAVTVVGAEGEAWHDVAILEYPSFEALAKITDSAEYEAEAAPHRRAALADWRFIASFKAQLPGS